MGSFHDDLEGSKFIGRPTPTTVFIFITILLQVIVKPSESLYIAEVQWTVGAPVSQYESYKDISLLSVNIPKHVQDVFWILRSYASAQGCPVRNVSVYLQPGRYPVVNPNNETFPKDFYFHKNQWRQYTVPSSNKTVETTVVAPLSGTWYAGVTMKDYDKEDIRQKGFKKDCTYSFSLITVCKVIENIWELSMEKSHKIDFGQDRWRLYKYVVPNYTVQYSIQISNCTLKEGNTSTEVTPCPISLTVSEEVVPSNVSYTIHCTDSKTTCIYAITSPAVLETTYLKIESSNVLANQSLSFVLHFTTLECKRAEVLLDMGSMAQQGNIFKYQPKKHPFTTANCLTPNSLGRYKIAPMDFSGVFVIHDFGNFPMAENQMFVSDERSVSTDFYIDPVSDLGGTLKISLSVREDRQHMKQGSHIWMCLMKSRVPYKTTITGCPGGALMAVNTTSEDNSYAELFMPYPVAGRWYISLQAICYNVNNTQKQEKCLDASLIEFMVSLSPCMEESCGEYGLCKEFISGIHIFSSCECYAGWRGYACTDGTHANSKSSELASVFLLSLSNLFFIPGIILALYRRYFVEALVYFFNMFFSTFYHACDSSKLYYLCIMKYDTLGFADFMGSILSFWVTLMAMARLHPQVRSLFHMAGVLCIAIWMDYDRHGLWESIVPIFGGILILLVSWARVWYKRRECFPSKWRYIKFLLPGFLLAATGLIIFSFLETQKNYLYTHSVWHVVMSLSIVFLLPPRRHVEKEHRLLVNEESFREEVVPVLTANMSDAGSLARDSPPPIFTLGSQHGSDDQLVL